MQTHKAFMILIYKSLRRYKFKYFLNQPTTSEFSCQERESMEECLSWIDDVCVAFCTECKSSIDEPSCVCPLYVEEVEAYL